MPHQKATRPERHCPTCGSILVRHTHEQPANWKRRIYCDWECWQARPPKPTDKRGTFYARARKHRKTFCERCGSREQVQIHHKDHDPLNGDPANLETLCKICHDAEHRIQGGTNPNHRKHFVCTLCGAPHHAKGLCMTHYQRLLKHGDPTITETPRGGHLLRDGEVFVPGHCNAPGCDKPAVARGYCKQHWSWWRQGRLP